MNKQEKQNKIIIIFNIVYFVIFMTLFWIDDNLLRIKIFTSILTFSILGLNTTALILNNLCFSHTHNYRKNANNKLP